MKTTMELGEKFPCYRLASRENNLFRLIAFDVRTC